MIKTARAILIDPFAKTVTDVQCTLAFGGPAGVYELTRCTCLDLIHVGKDVILWVDDEGLLKPWAEQRFFGFQGMERSIAGRALLAFSGTDDEGDTIVRDVPVTVEAVLARIGWVEPAGVVADKPTVSWQRPDGSWEHHGGGRMKYEENK